ncbi:MAG: cupin domain-containing protein [Chlorobi bacterium]|nr:cupin domain-containing protein [Chlorobiota bacterium]
MKIISLDQAEKMTVNMEGAVGVTKQMPLSRKDGVPVYSFRVFTVEPGGHTPYHHHNYEHMNYIVSGQGALVNEDGEELPVKAGDFALVLPNEQHNYKNTHPTEPLVLICGVPKAFE